MNYNNHFHTKENMLTLSFYGSVPFGLTKPSMLNYNYSFNFFFFKNKLLSFHRLLTQALLRTNNLRKIFFESKN